LRPQWQDRRSWLAWQRLLWHHQTVLKLMHGNNPVTVTQKGLAARIVAPSA
jgi:hypothetical protein